jgi:hypothetical protein
MKHKLEIKIVAENTEEDIFIGQVEAKSIKDVADKIRQLFTKETAEEQHERILAQQNEAWK